MHRDTVRVVPNLDGSDYVSIRELRKRFANVARSAWLPFPRGARALNGTGSRLLVQLKGDTSMDYKANVFTSLCQEIEACAEAEPKGFIVQDMLWDGVREEALMLCNGRKYSRLVNCDGEPISKWVEVKQEGK